MRSEIFLIILNFMQDRYIGKSLLVFQSYIMYVSLLKTWREGALPSVVHCPSGHTRWDGSSPRGERGQVLGLPAAHLPCAPAESWVGSSGDVNRTLMSDARARTNEHTPVLKHQP